MEGGEDSWRDVVVEFYKPFEKALNQIEGKKERIKSSLQEETDIACEKCGRKLITKWGKNGQFLACPTYPECKFSRPLEADAAAQQIDAQCPKCGSKLILKIGRYGKFAACEKYPDCKHTQPFPIGMDCPTNGCGGQVVEKRTRRGRTFFGCGNYPDCNFAAWDKPVSRVCPNCQNSYMLEKTSQKRGLYLKCPSCKEDISPD